MTASDPNPLRRVWLAVGLLLVISAVCISLGFWQLGRAEQSRALADRFEAANDLPVIENPMERAELGGLRYRQLEFQGRYVPERQFLIDNIVNGGVAGYYVLTPFNPDNSEEWLIVNRGWIPADPDRSVRPDVGVPPTHRRLVGRIDALPAPGLRLGDEAKATSDDPVVLLSYPTMTELERHLGRTLFDYQVLLDPGAPDGYRRNWSGPTVSPERNIAYAVQWWLFSAVAAVAAVALAWREIRRRPQ